VLVLQVNGKSKVLAKNVIGVKWMVEVYMLIYVLILEVNPNSTRKGGITL
jgi:hypothetical protein